MEKGRIEFDDPTFRKHTETKYLKTLQHCKPFDLETAFKSGVEAVREFPIDMILPCPSCGMLHVDAPEPREVFWAVERVGSQGEVHCRVDISGRHVWWGGSFGNWQTDINRIPSEGRFPSRDMAEAMLLRAGSEYEGDRLLYERCIVTEHALIGWDNPPHKSHLCHGCGIVWRPADVPTNGVAEIKTRGEKDTWPEENNAK